MIVNENLLLNILIFISTDILGIVISCDDVTQITTKTTNRQVCDFHASSLALGDCSLNTSAIM